MHVKREQKNGPLKEAFERTACKKATKSFWWEFAFLMGSTQAKKHGGVSNTRHLRAMEETAKSKISDDASSQNPIRFLQLDKRRSRHDRRGLARDDQLQRDQNERNAADDCKTDPVGVG